jgi:glycosyltransferase involved in cell wall biosynthesis
MEKFGFEVRVIPNVVDAVPADFRLRKSVEPRLIWMRSFHANYNPEMAIRTLALLKREHPDATLVMAGVDKGLEAGVKEAARAAGLEHSVRFPGFLDRESKLREFANADIYLNTNRIDNTPVSVIEACSMGLPVVATNVGGISQLLTHRETGLLVDDDRPDEMAEAIMELIRDPDLAERLSANGKILSDRSSWDAVRRSWSGLFDELAERSDVRVGKPAPDAVHHGNV